MNRKTIVVKELSPEQFALSITVPHGEPSEPVSADHTDGKSKYCFILTRDEMESLARNSLGAFSPKVEVPRRD